MSNKCYDAVFIGNGLTSLTAAATLAKAGQSVLLLDPINSLDPGLPHRAFRFSTGPLLYFGYETGGAMEGFFSQLAYPIPSLQQKGLRFKRVSPMMQIVQPSHRINLYVKEEPYFDELKREYSKQAQKLKVLFEQVAKETASYYAHIGQFQQLEIAGVGERLNEWKKRLEVTKAISNQKRQKGSDFLGQFAFSSDLRQYFDLLSLFAFKKNLLDISLFDLMMLLSGFQKGGVQMLGGYATLVGFLQDLIQGWGGSIISGKTILKIEEKGKQVTGLRLSDGRSLSGRNFVLTQPSERTTMTFYFSLPQDRVPSPMKELLLMSWGSEPPFNLEDLIVLRLNHLEEEPAESDKRLIAASVLLRSGSKILEAEYEGLQKKLLERLHWLIPFSGTHMEMEPAPLLSDQFEDYSQEALNGFLASTKKGMMRGSQKKITKGTLTYLQPRGEKNVFIVKTDRSEHVTWGSDFLAGSQLAELLIAS